MAQENIFWFVPNIIGYFRVVLSTSTCFLSADYPALAVSAYISSAVLDEFDGRAARYFDQCTRFGGLLDVTTDWCGSLFLMFPLAQLYPEYRVPIELLAVLQIFSAWTYTCSSYITGIRTHKTTNKEDYALLRFYYSSTLTLNCFYYSKQLVMVGLYAIGHSLGPSLRFSIAGHELTLWHVLCAVSVPPVVVMEILNVAKILTAATRIAKFDVEERKRERSGAK